MGSYTSTPVGSNTLPPPHLEGYDPETHRTDVTLDLDLNSYPNAGQYWEKLPTLRSFLELPRREQKHYADAITRKYVKNPVFLNKYDFQDSEEYLKRIDSVTVGDIANLAYIVEYNPELTELYAKVIALQRQQLTQKPSGYKNLNASQVKDM